jgi:outer membrane protein OmpA-like peptidoglycan-associated protein
MLSRIAEDLHRRIDSGTVSPAMLRDAKNFSEGRRGGNNMKFQWHKVHSISSPTEGEDITVKVMSGIFRSKLYEVDTLPTQPIFMLPELDPPVCGAFDRFFHRKQNQGWGLNNLRYEPFRMSHRKIIRNSFEVFFGKNSSEARTEDLQPVIDYLKENNLTILQVRIEGYSSIEGDSLANQALHKKRAQRLVSVLQRYNNEPIGADTVITTEAWSAFRELVRNSAYKWMDTLTNSAIRSLVNSNTELSEALEPYLRQLRKARLSITLASRYTPPEIVERLKREFAIISRSLSPSRTPAGGATNAEARLSGMIRYMDELRTVGSASLSDLAEMIDECAYPEQARILLFYHVIKRQEEQPNYEVSDSVLSSHQWKHLFEVAHNNIVSLIERSASPLERIRRLRQATDIQFYSIRYIQNGVLDPAVLCSMVYPDRPEFYGLKLNHYAMAYELSSRYSFTCFGIQKTERKAIAITAEEEQSRIEAMLSASRLPEKHAVVAKPTFDYSAKGDYYYFMQTLFLKEDERIRNFVSTSDNYAEFDLFTFLRTNITAWDPVNNHFYDSAVQLDALNRLVQKLKRMDERICREQVSQLYLDFHLKALHYLNIYFTPGSKQDAVLAEGSLNYISEYYRSRSNYMFPKLTIYLCDGLNYFSNLPTSIPAPEYAGRVLEPLVANTILTDAELLRWRTYGKLLMRPRKTNPGRQANPIQGRNDF